jgi:glycosyltransferase involved in cell wall biosynthesis
MPDFLVFSAFVPRLLGAKVVLMMYEPVPELWQTKHNSPPPRILKIAEQAALRYADASLTVTQQLKERYVRRGADGSKISVILNVPETRFLGLEGMPGEPPARDTERFTLISHGAIEERYGHDTMLEAVSLVKAEIPEVQLRILGRGSYVEEFLALRDRLGLEEHVVYLGWVAHEEMIRQLRAADVGIVAQKSSPYSNLVHTGKMYEFIAFGKPVLASRLESVSAYFPEKALRYFEPNDPESLAQGILDLYRDSAERESLVKNAQKLYNDYRWEKQQEVYLDVYRKLLE